MLLENIVIFKFIEINFILFFFGIFIEFFIVKYWEN